MRAVNLIPQDARRGGGAGGAGRSGGLAYVLLGGLAVLVALVAAWAYTGRTISQHRAELKTLDSQVQELQSRSAGQSTQTSDSASATEQLATVRSLALSRTDWSRTLDAIARTLPAHTSLSGLTAATSPNATPGGAGGGPAVASSFTGPSVQVQGCSPSQKAVALLLPRLRLIPGVANVSLVSATAASAPTGAAAAGPGTNSCSKVDFSLVLFMKSAAPPAPAPGTAPAAAATPAAGATPAAPAPASTGTGQ